MTDKVRLIRVGDGYRWRRRAPNGEIVAAATETYRDAADAIANAERVNGERDVDWAWDEP
jgi:uncharacterized protein YegP (UPF0339 family)